MWGGGRGDGQEPLSEGANPTETPPAVLSARLTLGCVHGTVWRHPVWQVKVLEGNTSLRAARRRHSREHQASLNRVSSPRPTASSPAITDPSLCL